MALDTGPARLSFLVEPWNQALPEMEPLWAEHYREVARDQAHIPLAPDYATYAELDQRGALHVVTARAEGRLAGYLVAVVRPHLHYRTTLHAFFDLYYLSPTHRRGHAGVQLFRAAEQSLKTRGVRKMMTGTKVHTAPGGRALDVSAIFQRLGWIETERQFGKWIG